MVSTPCFAKTDSAGRVRLRDLPASSHAVHAWHPRQPAAMAPVALALEACANPLNRLKYRCAAPAPSTAS